MRPRHVLSFALGGIVAGVLLLLVGSGPGADIWGLILALAGLCFVVELALPHRMGIAALAWLAAGVFILIASLVEGLGIPGWAGDPRNGVVILPVAAVGLVVLAVVWPLWWHAWWYPYGDARKVVAEYRRAQQESRRAQRERRRRRSG